MTNQVKNSYVYIISKNGKPLMPTKRFRKVRLLLKSGLAKPVKRKPFTIKLLYKTTEYTQNIILGIDPGSQTIGITARKDDGVIVFAGEIESRKTEVSQNMTERQMHRRSRRGHRRKKLQICEKLLEKPAQKQKLNDIEVITIAISSALFFNSNHDKALAWLFHARYFPTILSLSRYNRRVHNLKDIMEFCMEKIFDLFLNSETYITDSMPLPVCKRARARRNKKVRGREYCGYCAAKKEKFFGFRLHMIVNRDGVPVSVQILPGAFHDLTPLFEITYSLPKNSILLGDKAYNCQSIEKILKDAGITLMPFRKKNSKKQWFMCEQRFIRENRHQIETSFSILSDVMGLNRLKARTLNGFLIKTYASILALIFHIVLVSN